MSTHHRPRRLLAGVVAGVAATALGACGSSGGTTAKPAGTGTATAVNAAATAKTATCNGVLAIDRIPTPDGDPAPAAADVKAYGAKTVPIVDGLIKTAPAELQSSLALARRVFQAQSTTGKDTSQDDPKFQDAGNTIELWVHDNCGFQNVEATMVDYGFQGIPATLKSGPTSFKVKNSSTHAEFHVLLIAKAKAGTTLTAKQVEALTPDKAFASLDIVPGGAPAAAGRTGAGTFDLAPGTYVVFCPVGDPPHFMKGMVSDLTVT